MSIEALKELAAKVEAGNSDYFASDDVIFAMEKIAPSLMTDAHKSRGSSAASLVQKILSGSLDATKALHDALLPSWTIHIGTENNGEFHVIVGSPSNVRLYGEAFNAIMARAWLLAILRALIAQAQSEAGQ